ncbi:MAG: hypothetical protein WC454_10065 [Phycisphaerae bacterium]|jgi:hypothetical protein
MFEVTIEQVAKVLRLKPKSINNESGAYKVAESQRNKDIIDFITWLNKNGFDGTLDKFQNYLKEQGIQ